MSVYIRNHNTELTELQVICNTVKNQVLMCHVTDANSSVLIETFLISFYTVMEKFEVMYHLRQRMGQISMTKAIETQKHKSVHIHVVSPNIIQWNFKILRSDIQHNTTAKTGPWGQFKIHQSEIGINQKSVGFRRVQLCLASAVIITLHIITINYYLILST